MTASVADFREGVVLRQKNYPGLSGVFCPQHPPVGGLLTAEGFFYLVSPGFQKGRMPCAGLVFLIPKLGIFCHKIADITGFRQVSLYGFFHLAPESLVLFMHGSFPLRTKKLQASI